MSKLRERLLAEGWFPQKGSLVGGPEDLGKTITLIWLDGNTPLAKWGQQEVDFPTLREPEFYTFEVKPVPIYPRK